MYKKYRIIGTSGSGKSMLAKALAEKHKITSYDLDDIYFEKKYTLKRDKDTRKILLENITLEDSRIIEGAYLGDRTNSSLENADIIIFCYTSWFRLIYRILKREIKKGNSLKNMIGLIRYSLNYKNTSQELGGLLEKYKEKTIYVNTSHTTNLHSILIH